MEIKDGSSTKDRSVASQSSTKERSVALVMLGSTVMAIFYLFKPHRLHEFAWQTRIYK